MFDVMTGFIFVIATIGLTLGCYFVMRWLTGGDPEAKDRDLASSVIFRISALHGLILALVFAQEMVEYQQLRFESTIEANAIADIYNDARRYGTDESDLIRARSQPISTSWSGRSGRRSAPPAGFPARHGAIGTWPMALCLTSMRARRGRRACATTCSNRSTPFRRHA